MGTWGVTAFENDTASDWLADLCDSDDYSLLTKAFDDIEAVGKEYVEVDVACEALGTCEVLAALRGRPGQNDSFTEKMFDWLPLHPFKPGKDLINRGNTAIARILGKNSELHDLWKETDDYKNWIASVEDLRKRLDA